MKHCFLLIFLAGSMTLFTGCQTIDNRIKEKPEVFAQVDKATQEKIKQGIIDLGYSEDMVYLALGAPDQKREAISAAGRTITWIYNTYYQRYDGSQFAGYHRRVYFDPAVRTYRVYYSPVYADLYGTDKEERIRIVFKDGKASVIEQSKD